MIENGAISLVDSNNYSFIELILSFWSLIEFLIDQNVQDERASGVPMRATTREVLQGYEYKSIVEERSPFYQTQTYIAKTSGGWISLAKDIDALILFADGFQDAMIPAPETLKLCHKWRRVPKDKDYLTISVITLKTLYDRSGY